MGRPYANNCRPNAITCSLNGLNNLSNILVNEQSRPYRLRIDPLSGGAVAEWVVGLATGWSRVQIPLKAVGPFYLGSMMPGEVG